MNDGGMLIWATILFFGFGVLISTVSRSVSGKSLGLVIVAVSLLLMLMALFQPDRTDYTIVFKPQIARDFEVKTSDVSIRNKIDVACTRYKCVSWKAEVYVYETPVGIVEFDNDGAYIITYFVPKRVPVYVTPTPLPTDYPTQPWEENRPIERPLETQTP